MSVHPILGRTGFLAKVKFIKTLDEDTGDYDIAPGINFSYMIGKVDKDKMEGEVWFWTTDESEIELIKEDDNFIEVIE